MAGRVNVAAAPSTSLTEDKAPSTLPVRTVVAALAGMGAAWTASGAVGLLAHPLRHALTWAALLVAITAAWQSGPRSGRQWLLLAAAGAMAAVMTMSSWVVYNLLAVVIVLALLAAMQSDLARRCLWTVALAAGALALYRLSLDSIPAVWLAADAFGYLLGWLAGAMVHRPLWVGATFGGVDSLVLMAALYVGWLRATPPPRRTRGLIAAGSILIGMLLYFGLLCYAEDLRAALPSVPPPPETDQYVPPSWSLSKALASLLPWNVPLAGALIQLAIAAGMFRWVRWSAHACPEGALSPPEEQARPWLEGLAWVLATAIPLLITFAPTSSDLTGKRIVVYEEGYLNWIKPVFGRYGQDSAGAYGMLPSLVESLGGELVRSNALSEADLSEADVVLLLHPVTPWPEDLHQRVWEYVRRGGSLLVVAEPRVLDDGVASAFDEVLEPTSMRVRFDTAIAETYKWEHAVEALAHPATAGGAGMRNGFGLLRGSSIALGWPARPILVGRWGFSDPGSDAVMTDVFRFEPGEKLGDLVLAAEEQVGRGRVVVLGDSYGLTNLGMTEAYPFTGRLLGYLAWRLSSPQASWRQAAGLLGLLLLAGLLAWRFDPNRLAAVGVLVAFTLAGAREISAFQSQVLPDGGKGGPFNNLAYIDATHLEAYCGVDWTSDDLAGLKLTLMRNGYLPLLLYEFSAEAIERAGLLISIAPARSFSSDQRKMVRQYVENGGVFLCMVGAEHARPIGPLLEEFGFRVPVSPLPPGDPAEPIPMGAVRAAYVSSEGYRADIVTYAGWPIEYPNQGTEWFVPAVDGLPVAACARVGRGRVVVIGDTDFALNKNLEYVSGEPFEGRYDNAHFWRWLIVRLREQPEWMPPNSLWEGPPLAGEEIDPARAAAEGLRRWPLSERKASSKKTRRAGGPLPHPAPGEPGGNEERER